MSIADKYIVRFTNTNVNSLNFQLCDIDIQGNGTTAMNVAAAQIIAYFAGQGAESMADGTSITSVTYIASSTNLGVVVPFPNTEYDAIQAEFTSLPVMSAYGVEIGRSTGSLAPLGTSIVMTERTASGGPSGRGRHFLPFISEELVNTQGQVASTAITNLEANYKRFILDGFAATSLVNLNPKVVNAAGDTTRSITTAQAQPVFSNLASRRR